jgi:PKD repeat protein
MENPNHIYTEPDTYNVTLKVISKNGKKTDLASVQIEVAEEIETEPPVANFFYLPSVVYLGQEIQFLDKTSRNPNDFEWDFGNFSIKTEQNPTKVFNQIGNYPIKLTASNVNGSNSITKVISVTNEAAYLDGLYNVTQSFGGQNFTYTTTLSSSEYYNNNISTFNFGNYLNGYVQFSVSGSTINLYPQTISCGSPVMIRTFNGTGTISGTTITLNYYEASGGNTVNGTLTFEKQ